MSEIVGLSALEILDSRGNPTLSVTTSLSSGVTATAKVPSGASTGKREALELRDGDKRRYSGRGVLTACSHVEGEIQAAVVGRDASDQSGLDGALVALDGTIDKSRLGANAILGVSLAVARAAAQDAGVALYRYLATQDPLLPTPMLNVLNGGRHADNSLDYQEFMISPVGAPSFRDGLRAAVEVFHSLKSQLQLQGFSTAVGDEGGFAPSLESNVQAVDFILEAISGAGYKPGVDIALMLDPAASEFYEDGGYVFRKCNQRKLSSLELIAQWKQWLQKYPEIWSLEDGIAEQDHQGWIELTQELGDSVQLVGDDNFVTNPRIFEKGIEDNIANAILIKLNQIGTVTETLKCIELAQVNGYGVVISHRSGETDDTSIADLAVAVGAGQIKTGSASRGERVAKYNRLLQIECELGSNAKYAGGHAYRHWHHALAVTS
jgi:enolase